MNSMSESALNPAEKTARETRNQIRKNIDEGKSFLVEAGAGAGKTFSLIETLKYLIGKKGKDYKRQNKKIACITYTNMAVKEIEMRIDKHPVVLPCTIHTFCWSIINRFQKYLCEILKNNEKWQEKLSNVGLEDFGTRKVKYKEPAIRKIKDEYITIHHNDVLALTVELMKKEKFRTVFKNKYPVILIDEYQNTNKEFINILESVYLSNEIPLIGFFGDPWQMIYPSVCGRIEHPNVIQLKSNFRSVPIIVKFLNNMRPDLQQEASDPSAEGIIKVYETNNWAGAREVGSHTKGDLPSEISYKVIEVVKNVLTEYDWNFDNKNTKILMLTHKNIADECGYSNLIKIFKFNESLIKKEHYYIKFFAETLEPFCKAYKEKLFGEMFSYSGTRSLKILNITEKNRWKKDMDELLRLRDECTIGDVLEHLKLTKRPYLPENVRNFERELETNDETTREDESSSLILIRKLKNISYKEIIKVVEFIDEKTVYSTKHGIKGAEKENVFIVFGRGWNMYNWNEFLEWVKEGIPPNKEAKFFRNRNLFYVSCSRAIKRLAILFTQKLSDDALNTLEKWFGENSIQSLQFNEDTPFL